MEDNRTQSDVESVVTVRQPLSLLRRLGFWRKRKKPPEKPLRNVVSNASLPSNLPQRLHPHRGYRDNKIRTTKYTLLSFIPKNLFEQFHRFANLYFILIVLLNWVPRINAFGKEVAIIPVVFVLGVTAIKDWFEDFRRYKSDKRVNKNTCRVYSREAGRYVKTLWKSVKVGDFVHLSCNEVIPADLLMLRCSDENGLCYIETANIDGESNLKQREVARPFMNSEHVFHPSTYQCRIECDPPNHRIYRFNGCVIFPSGERVPLRKENLLLRDCVVKNTDFVEGIVVYAGHETKAMLNNGGPRYKRSRLEKLMNRDVVSCVFILLLLCFLGALGHGFWLGSFEDRNLVPFMYESDHEWYEVPREAFFVFLTFIIVLQVMIPLSLYVTIEIIKLGQVYFIHEDINLYDSSSDKRLECRALNITEELGQIEYIFSDKTGTLTENNMVFRHCTIGGVDYNHERTTPASSVGGDSSSYDETKENIFRSDSVIPNECLLEELSNMEIELRLDSSAAEIVHLSHHNQRIQDFFFLLAVCNTVVVAKYPHKDQMNSSGLCLNISTPTSFRHKSWSEGWESTDEKYAHLLSYTTTPNSSSASTPARRPDNLAIPGMGVSAASTPTASPFELKPIYEAESPDEIALVNAAFAYNCRLLRRTPDSVVLSLPGEGVIEFKVLHVLPFDASRKRMSVILEHPLTGQKILFCKGADSTVLPHLAPARTKEMKEIIMKTQQHLNSYSRKGLRILCMAKKVIPADEYAAWAAKHKEAECCFDDKEKKLYYSACAIEKNLELLGATGIEDRLQSGVPSTIQSLRAAGIVLWVLTGDKQETAVNIAYSCKLFSTDMEVITLNARSKEATEETLRFYIDQIGKDVVSGEVCSEATASSSDSGYFSSIFPYFRNQVSGRICNHRRKERALVIDGHTLAFILDQDLDKLFLKLAHRCMSVLCCRATPLQKASIVKMIKDNLCVKTLAIGDGANDVSMIQVADVGVGISGREGMQAVMASDFALARFSYLERLLLVHGHWCYDRLARTVLYFFYKNASFIFVICWYQWFCGFSATVMIDEMYLMLFNVLFISLPPVVQGILDKNCPEDLLLRYPYLYARGQKSQIHTKYAFWLSMLDAVYQSIVTFFIPFIAYNDSDVGIWEFGTTICTACVVVQLLHLAIETRSWTYLHVLSMIASIFIYFGFAITYNVWPAVSVGMLQSPYWVIIHAMKTPVFWFCIILVPVVSCLPRFALRALHGSVLPSPVMEVLIQQKRCKTPSDNSTLSVSWSRESSGSSVDLRCNHRQKSGFENQVFSINGDMAAISANSVVS